MHIYSGRPFKFFLKENLFIKKIKKEKNRQKMFRKFEKSFENLYILLCKVR